MAKYTFGVPWCNAIVVRSLLKDSLYASTALQVMNAEGALQQSFPAQPAMDLGDFGNDSTVNTNLFFADVDVQDPTPELPDGGSISWSFILANAGQPDYVLLVSAITNAAAAISGAAAGAIGVGSNNVLFLLVAGGIIGTQALLQLLTADCDGPVAALSVSYTAAQLAQMTNDPQSWAQKMNFPGTKSSHGCGANSNYDVYYVISNQSQTTVPNLWGTSPVNAQALVQEAGLVFSSAVQKTGPRQQVPTVEGQEPAAGSLAVPGSLVMATIIEAAPHGHPTP